MIESSERKVDEMLKEYANQVQINEKNDYEDEMRAEADLCAECCHCMRTCCIMNS